MKDLNLTGFEHLYSITEDGELYSKRKQRYLKGQINDIGYKMFWLQPDTGKRGKFHMAARLVLLTYVGNPPDKHEANHIDHNKLNNHFSNLEWVTHSENIKMSYDMGHRIAEGRKPGFKHSEDTKCKIADAKMKPIEVTNIKTGIKTVYKCIQEACDNIEGMYRKKIERIIKMNKYGMNNSEYNITYY